MQENLTIMQQFALPVLLWFFDCTRDRATGRSYLMARVLIELMLRGQEVVLVDRSMSVGLPLVQRSYFISLVQNILQKNYPYVQYTYHRVNNTLRLGDTHQGTQNNPAEAWTRPSIDGIK